MCERNIIRLPLTRPQLGTWPATQTCALTGDGPGKLAVCWTTPNLWSHTSHSTNVGLETQREKGFAQGCLASK